MDLSGVKKIFSKLGFIKSFYSFFIFLLIAIIAVVVLLPANIISSNLKEDISQQSVAAGRQIRSMVDTAVPRDQWKEEQRYQKNYSMDANRMSMKILRTTQRELLSYKIFPEPNDKSIFIFEDFGKNLDQSIEGLFREIHAGVCPTDAEIERYLPNARASSSRLNLSSGSGNVSDTILDLLCQDKANAASIYAFPEQLGSYGFWDKYQYVGIEEAVKECWYQQIAYWIIEDVMKSIGQMNSGSNSVMNSPVKRLMYLYFDEELKNRKRASLEEEIDKPQYVKTENDFMVKSFTGRISNEDIDVVHFQFSVLVDAREVLPFMKELCSSKDHIFRGWKGKQQPETFRHNQITILESDVVPVDRNGRSHQLYRYGQQAVVELQLVCEYVFNKKAYESIVPKTVKESQEEETSDIPIY